MPPATHADADLARLAVELGAVLRRKRLKLAVAESCTGGWVAKCVTDVAGSSQWFDRGFVAYTNRAKQDLLGVSPQALLQFGAVSAQVAKEMAEGALIRSNADATLSITGIAGPDGGSPDKPVGTVWLGWAVRGQPAETRQMRFDGDRDMVRRAAVAASLARMVELIETPLATQEK
jgi:nicotinamide-nucleotide amidase